MEIYLDIETVPIDNDDVIAAIDAKYPLAVEPEPVTHDRRLTDPAKIKDDLEARQAKAWADLHVANCIAMEKRNRAFLDTALDGNLGRIVSISVALDEQEALSFSTDPTVDGEREMIVWLGGVLAAAPPYTTLIAHFAEFDVRYIYQRAVILGVAGYLPPWWPPFTTARMDERRVFDTMTRWAGFGNRIGLDRLCRTLGLPGKGAITGADVEGLWRQHRYDLIASYNSDDIRRLRSVHRRMTGREPLRSDIDALLDVAKTAEAA